ncbi:hypothetical protein C8J57DRAFT_1162331 [Mycena rebaudengoi]|nr:hypothetical protein C8J57DRAFT_1162331 [Mycena rebaudengoi]
MAALALHGRHILAPAFRIPFLTRPFALAAVPTFLAASRTWQLPSFWQSLLELFPPFVLAVPKKKVSHSRKSMRSATKGLKDKHNIVNCPGCGAPKLAHHLCNHCFSFLTRMWKETKRFGETEKI